MASETLAKEAVDYCRRNNLRLLVAASGLLLVWAVNIEGGYEAAQESMAQARQTDVQIENLHNVLDYVVLIRREKINDLRSAETSSPADSRRVQELSAKVKQIDTIKQKAIDAKKLLASSLTEKITFEVGGGVKLPFAFSISPIVWMLVLIYLQISVVITRAAFWGLLALPIGQVPVGARTSGNLLTYDIPIWLFPIPEFHSKFGLSREDAGAAIGVSIRGLDFREFLQRLAIFAVIAVAGRVFISGNYLYSEVLPSFSYRAVLVLLFGMSIALAICSLFPGQVVPGSTEADLPRSPAFNRRHFAVAALGSFVAALASARWLDLRNEDANQRARETLSAVYFRLKPRKPSRATLELSEGFYRHRRSDRVFYVQSNGSVFGGGRTLKSSNLNPSPSFKATSLSLVFNEISQHDLISKQDLRALGVGFETAAISLAANGAPDDGIAILYWYISEFLSYSPDKPPLHQIDLAAGLAIRYGLSEQLAGLIEFCRGVPYDGRSHDLRNRTTTDRLDARIWKWTKPGGTKWRHNRWSRQFPMRWDGRRYDS